MSSNMNFHRFDRNSTISGFLYNSTDNTRELGYEFQDTSMGKTGFNIYVNVQNYMAESVLLGGNLRVNPTRIKSLLKGAVRPRDDFSNHVIITILSSENSQSGDPKKRTTFTRKTDIRIPGKMLTQGSVFISELDCYITTESQIDATRELIARDVSHHGWDSINIPSSMIKQDPAKIYVEYKQFVKFCLQRQDKINIRVGVDLRYGSIPEYVRSMRVSILDSYFVPFSCNKLVYDPTLSPDEFVIENLHMASDDEFRSSFSELKEYGSMYLDHDEVETMFGTFYGMAIFSDEEQHLDYVYRRKTQERFKEETLRVAHLSGDPRLKEEIDKLTRETQKQKTAIEERDYETKILQADVKRLKGIVRDREEALTKLRAHHDAKMTAEHVAQDMRNEADRIRNEEKKIENERIDLEFKEKAAPMAHKASMLKALGEILKSGWGIVAACLGGVLSIIALCKKYNVKISMSA